MVCQNRKYCFTTRLVVSDIPQTQKLDVSNTMRRLELDPLTESSYSIFLSFKNWTCRGMILFRSDTQTSSRQDELDYSLLEFNFRSFKFDE
jgi:hypothetical protein